MSGVLVISMSLYNTVPYDCLYHDNYHQTLFRSTYVYTIQQALARVVMQQSSVSPLTPTELLKQISYLLTYLLTYLIFVRNVPIAITV